MSETMENVIYYSRCSCGKTNCEDCHTERCSRKCYAPDERAIKFKELIDKLRKSGQLLK